MKKLQKKLIRYKNIFKTIINWKYYLFMKIFGFKKHFDLCIKNLGTIRISKNMLGPFRENFFDNVYFKYIPTEIFEKENHLIILDIGSNVGFFSLATFAKFPKSEIYSFEPHPFCFEVMTNYKHTFRHYKWNIYQQAVSNLNGKINLNTSSVSEFTTMASVFQNETKKEKHLVKSIKLDFFISESNLINIDFIKIDCEGAEYSIIYNLPKKIFERINALSVETHKGENENENTVSLNNYLMKIGYKTKMYDEGKYTGYVWAWKSN